ncbi:MAG: YceI family protein [Anaerolineae bacterium]|nr:YceI family protein [Anaerolineae bacterium]
MQFGQTMNRITTQNKPLKVMAILAVGVAVVVAVVAGYVWFSGGSAQPSNAISAPGLTVSGTARLFHMAADQSEARFITSETLLGQPKTVIGATKELAGDIAVDFDKPVNSKIGIIRVNARTLQTDNEIRNRALRGQVLQANKPEFEFVTFAPKTISGLPDHMTIGEKYALQILGDLTVHGVTRPVTFEAAVTPVSADRIEGTARTTVQYKDFNIVIPEAPGVANISDSVRLEIDFVALPASR